MQGIESVVARLAVTVVKALLTPRPGAGLVAKPVRPLPKPASPERLARVLGGRIEAAYGGLPEHERLAAVAAVQDTFAGAGELTADRLFAVDLQPAHLAAELRRPVADLSEGARDLYGELLGLCCVHLVEQLTAEPSFVARAAVEQTRRSGELLRERDVPVVDPFEERYGRYVAEAQARVELFGVTLGGRHRAEWPLDTAYLSLSVSGERERWRYESAPASVRVEHALAGGERLLVRGPAGSGKSTLLQWVALNAARRSFGRELEGWNRLVPFVLRLRSFHSPEALPMPTDFLSAAGVPLRAPQGWVEELLESGRAVVLVDGVDEVPVRLRDRTEKWLRSLVTAFPRARYLVTTRPSAVPEDWLAPQGFTAHTLLPMERDDIRSFVRHWHNAAREECPGEAVQLDRYEAGLGEAVATRRDLGRLATNPLMCALLCALNRDRRMQLPRARKELYDAALDMLLVRRDSEREIGAVEGVSLSREEQTVLLQRLAYWMIRNGQVEIAREEAVGLVAGWLEAMPQVRAQGDAGRVFTHLLIRTGLLREPTPGYVDFVHRTFQDYLGAKAAVEARDFGLLVKNAHDDQWGDVVCMAVGHARVDERGLILRALLREAGKVRRHRDRLVLLAAASLDHAPELDPEVREEVEARTGVLMPPRSDEQSGSLAGVGQLALELLPGPEGLAAREAAAVVRTAQLVGGDAALGVIARFRKDERLAVRTALGYAWQAFDAVRYFEAVLEGTVVPEEILNVRRAEELALLPRLPQLTGLNLIGDHGIPEVAARLPALEFLGMFRNSGVDGFSRLKEFPQLRRLSVNHCTRVADLNSLAGSPLTHVYLYTPLLPFSLAPLADLPELQHLTFDFQAPHARLDQLAFAPRLTGLGLFEGAGTTNLAGIEAMTRLEWLTLTGERQWRDFLARGVFSPLRSVQLMDVPLVDFAELTPYQDLTKIYLSGVKRVANLAALAELPRLKLVEFSGFHQLDVVPLAPLDHVDIHLYSCRGTIGTHLIPVSRLIED
ncbi:NACHT domain-containing protein [Streptomyces acidiscabies]|uniref:ATP-binding protein n=1 Tax=Streptomyces acidiscabies TaxID=42234 RepID=A0A0L0JFL0_9ACTN|nr:NACHT domain-containing protein [Streptomyces acidiscabies]KND24125.1 ATP-binding protein [Streptomyces acidiscabies]